MAAHQEQNETGGITSVTNTGGNENTQTQPKRKEHPLGKMVKFKVFALSSTEKKSQVFVSINKYSFEFQQNTEVKAPKAVVDFLKGATKIKHTVNEKGFAEQETEPLYAVTHI